MFSGKKFRRKQTNTEIVEFFLDANVEEIFVVVEYQEQGLTEFSLKGVSMGVSIRKSYTNVDCKLKEILLLDCNPTTVHRKVSNILDILFSIDLAYECYVLCKLP